MRRGLGHNSVKLKHVQTVRKPNGAVFRYLRVPGRDRVKLPDLPPEHPAFIAAYLAALGPVTAAPVKGSIAGLVEGFLMSRHYLGLSVHYRATVARNAQQIAATGGAALAAHLRPDHIRADCAGLAPHAARARLKTWRLLCQHGYDNRLIQTNPAETIRAVKAPATDGHLPWSLDQIAAFRAHWSIGTQQRRAFELLYWTGARTIDAVTLGPGHIGRDGVLSYRQSKTGKPAYVPWSCDLPAFVDAADLAHLAAAIAHGPIGQTFLDTGQGKSRTPKGLSNLISAAAVAAKVAGRSAHGLRKSRTVALVDGGATEAQGMAWTGHATSDEFQHYAKARDRRAAVKGASVNAPPKFTE